MQSNYETAPRYVLGSLRKKLFEKWIGNQKWMKYTKLCKTMKNIPQNQHLDNLPLMM